jgi:flagellar biosynthetic protein FliP
MSLFLTFFIMAPVGERIHSEAIQPLSENQISMIEAVEKAKAPVAEFMLSQVADKDLRLFYDISKRPRPQTREEVEFVVLVPAFILSEVRIAFQMGFLVLIPFMVIDLIVGSVLMSMGMMMLPPTLIALPIKVMLFVLADGWGLLIGSLVRSFSA